MKTEKYFDGDDIGCWGDGSFGHDHVRYCLAQIVAQFDDKLAHELRRDMPDDADDEREAIDLLNSNTMSGLFWEFVDGDLMLLKDGDL